MERLIYVNKLKDTLEYAILANVPDDAKNTKEEKWNDWIQTVIDRQPTVEAIPKDQINKAIEKIEQYICDVETDTVKAQGMAHALEIFEQVLGEVRDGNDN
jgi:hypothetical protein